MPRLIVVLIAALLGVLLHAAPAAHAVATVSLSGDTLSVLDPHADGNRLTVSVDGDDYLVEETDLAEPGLTAGANCTGGYTAGNPAAPVRCERTAPTATGLKVEAALGNGNGGDVQHVTVEGALQARLYGGNGVDELVGGSAGDELLGGDGADNLIGRGGADRLSGQAGDDGLEGGEDADFLVGGLGSDVIADTGTSGTDVASYDENWDPDRTQGVDVTLDGVQNDGSPDDGVQRDLVTHEIESLAGTDFADVLEGDGGPNALIGWLGDDVLIGGHGADRFQGHGGADTLHADDGVADTAIDCNNSDSSRGTAPNTAYIDRGLDDAVVVDCSTVLPPAGTDNAPPAGGQPTSPGVTGPSAPPVTPARAPTFFTLVAAGRTTSVAQMPNVVGVAAARARERILDVVANPDIDIDFVRGCDPARDGEIMRQTPLRGAAVASTDRDPAQIKLVMCLADRDFLRDCDLTDLRADLRKVRGKADAEFTTALLAGVNRCQVDYDVRMAKKAEEAKMALAAQKPPSGRSKKGEVRAAIDCPSAPSANDLRVYAKEDYVLGRLNTSFGLRASGPDGWTLPAGFQSFVTLEGIDRSFQFLEDPTSYIDADDVTNKGNLRRRQVVKWRDGRMRFNLFPEKAGTIRICTIMETGADEVLSHALEIEVVPRPKNGTRWETVGGRVIEVTADGGRWLTTAQAGGVAQAAFLDKVWGLLVGLFDGRSKTVNAQASKPTPNRQKTEAVYTQARLGMAQLTLDGKLDGDPQPPKLADGPCFTTQPDGTVALGRCKQLQTATGNTALLGSSYGDAPLVAAGAGNVIKADRSNLIGMDGATLAGPDGATLVGMDGGTLVGMDGGTLVGLDGGTLVGMDGATLIGNDGSTLVAAGGGNGIAVAPAQLVAAGAGNLVAAGAGNLVAAGGLN